MSAADLLEDSFPHGTPQGYDRGCRGMRCRGVDDFGWSCSYAKQQYSGDYHWRQWVDQGMTPTEIRIARGAQAAAPVKAKDVRAKLATVPTVSIADSREPVDERPKQRRVAKPRPVPNPAASVRHVVEEVDVDEKVAGFEVFHRGASQRELESDLWVRVTTQSMLTISRETHRQIGGYVALLFDAATGRVALQARPADDEDAYKVNPESRAVSAGAFIRHHGLQVKQRYELTQVGELFVGTAVDW